MAPAGSVRPPSAGDDVPKDRRRAAARSGRPVPVPRLALQGAARDVPEAAANPLRRAVVRRALTAAVANLRVVAKRAPPREVVPKAIALRPEGPVAVTLADPSAAATARARASPARRRVRWAASAEQAAALPPGEPAGRGGAEAAGVSRAAGHAAAALPAERHAAAEGAAAERAGAAGVLRAARGAAEVRPPVAPGARAEPPSAVAWACRRDPILPWPAPSPAERFARATASRSIASPSARWWRAAVNVALS